MRLGEGPSFCASAGLKPFPMLMKLLSSGWDRLRDWVRRRGTPFVLAVLAELLIALFLLSLAPTLVPKKKPIPTIFGFDLAGDEAPAPEERASKDSRPKSGGGATSPVRRPEPIASPTPEPPVVVPHPDVIWLNRRDYAASDIARNAPQPGAETPADVASGTSASRYGDSEVIGRGPRGEPLYAAEWYREPTDAELGTYLPKDLRQNGVGLVACRTIEGYRVEDCQEIGETPRGSGLSRAVRLAAWQFRVRPPRKGGKPLLGSWVRIRIDYTFRREPVPSERPVER